MRKWLDHRAALRAAGLARGFQWLDGSFVETKEPKDLDTVIFTYRPLDAVGNDVIWNALVLANLALLERGQVMQAFRLDALLIDLDSGNPEFMIDVARYYVGLFSHRRGDDLWKGMLKVRLEDVADDAAALAILEAAPAVGAVGP
ncbi:hypothetical protein GGR00_004773 [Aminobacter aganoensis]|uniref:Uncharacterized protein n=1 Tax=Aminobacter aganoensis TaxID=83264 RepID=A0A7X0KN96_9HYPH|nr:hypothetical protein [Aminobacter aganoensis]